MFYHIIKIKLDVEMPDANAVSAEAICTIQDAETGEQKEVVAQLTGADLHQLRNLLRQKIDKTLNGE